MKKEDTTLIDKIKKAKYASYLITVVIRDDAKSTYTSHSFNSDHPFQFVQAPTGLCITLFALSFKGTVFYQIGHNHGQLYQVKMKAKFYDENDNYIAQTDQHLKSPEEIEHTYKKILEQQKKNSGEIHA